MNHPLTDELCDQIVSSTPPLPRNHQDRVLSYDGRILDGMFAEFFEEQKHQMRAAADWQLEQVIEWLKNNLCWDEDRQELFDLGLSVYGQYEIDVDKVVCELKKAMRPQEDNS